MSSALALALLLTSSAAPPASQAVELARAQKWEELYLAFATGSPRGYSAKDQARIAGALGEGCEALALSDKVMAYSLGEKSVEFNPRPDPMLCTAAAAIATQQRTAGEALLKQGRKRFRRDARFPLELGRLALDEKDFKGAVAALSAVPARSKERAEAQGLLVRARGALNAQQGRSEAPPQGTVAASARPGRSNVSPIEEPSATGSLTYRSTVDGKGRQVMYNSRFRFKYFSGDRDFGQRADYEYRIRQALDEVYDATAKVLGVSRRTPVDVVLYSGPEFVAAFGPQMASAVAGLYFESAIHMNDTASITPKNKAVLVHEYTHAVIDELSGFKHPVPAWLNEGVSEYTSWQYQRLNGPPAWQRQVLQQAASAGRLPSLEQLTKGPLIDGSAALNYAMAGAAAQALVKRRNVDQVVGLIRDLGIHEDMGKALEERFDKTLPAFEADLRQSLGQR